MTGGFSSIIEYSESIVLILYYLAGVPYYHRILSVNHKHYLRWIHDSANKDTYLYHNIMIIMIIIIIIIIMIIIIIIIIHQYFKVYW